MSSIFEILEINVKKRNNKTKLEPLFCVEQWFGRCILTFFYTYGIKYQLSRHNSITFPFYVNYLTFHHFIQYYSNTIPSTSSPWTYYFKALSYFFFSPFHLNSWTQRILTFSSSILKLLYSFTIHKLSRLKRMRILYCLYSTP